MTMILIMIRIVIVLPKTKTYLPNMHLAEAELCEKKKQKLDLATKRTFIGQKSKSSKLLAPEFRGESDGMIKKNVRREFRRNLISFLFQNYEKT